MSFLLDPPLLVATAAALERTLPDERSRQIAAAAVVGTFVGTSAALYLDRAWTAPLWRLCGARSGRDWMLNSGLTRFEHEHPPPWVHVLAVALFAIYPAWYRVGRRLGVSRH